MPAGSEQLLRGPKPPSWILFLDRPVATAPMDKDTLIRQEMPRAYGDTFQERKAKDRPPFGQKLNPFLLRK